MSTGLTGKSLEKQGWLRWQAGSVRSTAAEEASVVATKRGCQWCQSWLPASASLQQAGVGGGSGESPQGCVSRGR